MFSKINIIHFLFKIITNLRAHPPIQLLTLEDSVDEGSTVIRILLPTVQFSRKFEELQHFCITKFDHLEVLPFIIHVEFNGSEGSPSSPASVDNYYQYRCKSDCSRFTFFQIISNAVALVIILIGFIFI